MRIEWFKDTVELFFGDEEVKELECRIGEELGLIRKLMELIKNQGSYAKYLKAEIPLKYIELDSHKRLDVIVFIEEDAITIDGISYGDPAELIRFGEIEL